MATDIDPTSMAYSLATLYVQNAQDQLDTESTRATATASALTKLQSALATLSGQKGMVANTATVSDSSALTASASSSAASGTYSLYVEQIATTHQIAFQDLPAELDVYADSPLVITLGDGSSISLDLQTADADGDGKLTPAEIARAINQADNNNGKVVASVVTVGNKSQLILSAGESGTAGAISVDVSGLPDGDLKTALSSSKELVAAQDAIVWLGDKDTGIKLEQSSNTFTAISGVTLTLTKASTSAITLSVDSDLSGTTANLQSFVDAYNALEKILDTLTANGSSTTDSAAFASDSGIRALRSRLSSILRESVDGVSLMTYGITTSKDGSISLDSDKLEAALAKNPDGLDSLFGSTTKGSRSGVLGDFTTYLELWTNSTNGLIKSRKDSVERTQSRLDTRQTRIDENYERAYNRYLVQYTALQTLQTQMEYTSSIFDAYFGTSSSSSSS
ncbi:MAG: lateral flagellar hook-associated protein 2 [Candidatus Dactylopiibacterium carminicum]|uniref:Flagellar hook-associated protein 2 n=1 Tax=Candidatus Dactylopiibacterium carminicum TaxID=857335 RepID=A0A272EWI0_9RHOO|nr:flagellar filament capping protein FliD [Candidatus Dactylopiibacterium carminicum]KAF7599968.1 lateral flagellar hook-associated protein 2 [Candidatus Dactylopiibacterium carminicum]PAS94451.1 MAG: lateral flagellar hook-associated protein 2 [Candidatus Dactylopiibacterium carminicum]PAS97064.1 MAG: lateral flagellar hook-associated protein 2 [Candidatus Dactylopiibacterium carminicum]PAS99971.1 MAG: lateral flagellar hook-associated protein 2 [Candidatus Dactylopiibacterium carminicum]